LDDGEVNDAVCAMCRLTVWRECGEEVVRCCGWAAVDGPLEVQWAMLFELCLLLPLLGVNEVGGDAEDPQPEMGDVPGTWSEADAWGCCARCLGC
jgi:hypothetical protein